MEQSHSINQSPAPQLHRDAGVRGVPANRARTTTHHLVRYRASCCSRPTGHASPRLCCNPLFLHLYQLHLFLPPPRLEVDYGDAYEKYAPLDPDKVGRGRGGAGGGGDVACGVAQRYHVRIGQCERPCSAHLTHGCTYEMQV